MEPFWIDKIGGGAGQGVGPDGLPVRQIGAGLDHDAWIGEAGEGEAETARLPAGAARGDRREQQHGGQLAVVCSPAGGAAVVISPRARANAGEPGSASLHVKNKLRRIAEKGEVRQAPTTVKRRRPDAP